MSDFLSGAAGLAFLAIAVYFLRFWRETRDRFFLWFAATFAVFAANRVVAFALPSENRIAAYVVRLVGFAMIIVAVVDKNISAGRPPNRE